MDVNDFPGIALTAQDHRLGRDPIDCLALVGSGRSTLFRDPGNVPDRLAGAPGDLAGNGLGEGRVRAEVMRSIFLPAALDAASFIDQRVLCEMGQRSLRITMAQGGMKGIDHGRSGARRWSDRSYLGSICALVRLRMRKGDFGQQQCCGHSNYVFHSLLPSEPEPHASEQVDAACVFALGPQETAGVAECTPIFDADVGGDEGRDLIAQPQAERGIGET